MRPRTTLAAALVLLVGCGGERSAEDTEAIRADAAVGSSGAGADADAPPLACEGLEGALLGAPLERERLAAAFGPPEGRTLSARPNLHVPDAADTVIRLAWPGLRVVLLKPPGPRTLPVEAEVADGRYLAHPGVAPGTRAEEVVALLGPPAQRSAEALVYDCGPEVSQPVTFHLSDGRVERIHIAFYVD